MGSLGTHIPKIKKNFPWKSPLDGEAPILNVRQVSTPGEGAKGHRALSVVEGWINKGRRSEEIGRPAVLENHVVAGISGDRARQESCQYAPIRLDQVRGVESILVRRIA